VLLESLNSEYSTKVNFESIISAKGADGDKVALIRAWGAPGWDFHVAHTAYELICHFRDSDIEYAFKVSIDAGSFHHEMRSLEEELSCIHIHCPTSAMDIKARISRTARSDWPSECNSFVESLIASLSVE
jgi:hypothetical protein